MEFAVRQLHLRKNNLPNPVFRVHFRSNEDWEAWERLSKMKGEFLYDSTIQMGHRIHEESETSIIIGDNARSKEDYEMFCKILAEKYRKSIVESLCKKVKNQMKLIDEVKRIEKNDCTTSDGGSCFEWIKRKQGSE